MIALKDYLHDGITYFLEHELQVAGDDVILQGQVVDQTLEKIALLPSPSMQQTKLNELAGCFKGIGKTELKKQLAEINRTKKQDAQELGEDEIPLPKGFDRDTFHRLGYFWKVEKDKTGYYVRTSASSNELKKIGNFVIHALYHAFDQDSESNARIIQVNNGFETRTLEVPSKDVLKPDAFMGLCAQAGNFVWDADKNTHIKIMRKIMSDFVRCFTLKTLGWQPEGFFAFHDKVWYDGHLLDYNDTGIVKVGDEHYLSLGASNLTEGMRQENDYYENDRYLSYKPSPIDFSKWMHLFKDAYGTQCAQWAIAFSIMTAFKDIVTQNTKIPVLYAYGQPQSGKSSFGESIQYFFFSGKNNGGNLMRAFSLNQGTDYAFFNRMERFRNCPNLLNEFDEDAIKEEWFRAIKSVYDGEGREKGTGRKNRATSQKIECTVILIGQTLTSKDDNSVLSRSIPIQFKSSTAQNRPATQMKAFAELMEHEKTGLSGCLVELLMHRPHFLQHFNVTFSKRVKQWNTYFTEQNERVSTRVLNNVSALITCIEVLKERVKFPFTWEEMEEEALRMIRYLSQLLADTDALADFWQTVEYLTDTEGTLTYGWDYEVSLTATADWTDDEGALDTAKKVVYLRLNNVQSAYAQHKSRTRSGALNKSSIRQYLTDHPAYLGPVKHHDFVHPHDGRIKRTSCMAFDYELLGYALEMGKASDTGSYAPATPEPDPQPVQHNTINFEGGDEPPF